MRLARCLCLAALLGAAGQVGCQAPAPGGRAGAKPVLSASARPPATAGLAAGQIEQGATLFVGKCARCHPLYDPTAYSHAEWQHWMAKMSWKAHLKPDQEETLTHYLEAFRTRNQ